ncbi:hypothetical protein Dimus_018013, partial [Dionaea muscipula]
EEEDELLSEILNKAKRTKQASEEWEKLRQQAKRKGDSRGVFDDSDFEDDEIEVQALPSEIIMKKRVTKGKIIRENWLNDNGLSDVMNLIKRQKWERLFRRRELMHTATCKEFYANLTMFLYKKKEVARSRVRGVEIEFDSLKLASILGVLGNTGICEYIKDVWEESKYIKPLETTRRFANDEMITTARRVKSIEMKPFQRFLHFVVMKNVVPRFDKRDTTSFMDLTYMDHLSMRRLVNLPRVMMRHISYVISVKDHELPYGDWLTMVFEAFDVPLIGKQGEEPKRYDFFEETFLSMCQLKRENGVWWLGSGENRRRDDEEAALVENEEVNEEAEAQQELDCEVVIDEVELEREEVNPEAEIQGEHMDKEVEAEESGSGEKFFDAVDKERPDKVDIQASDVPALAPTSVQQKEKNEAGVNPSIATGSIPDLVFMTLQVDLERARADRIQADLDIAQAENARLLALLQQAQTQHKP